MDKRIFARARMPTAPRPPTPKELAEAVRRPAAFQAAQAELDRLHECRAAAADEMRVVAAGLGSDHNRVAEKRAQQLNREIRQLDLDIAGATSRRDQERQPYASAVASALAPLKRAAVSQAIAAVDELVAALALIDEANRELQRVGSAPGLKFPPVYRAGVRALRDRLRRLGQP